MVRRGGKLCASGELPLYSPRRSFKETALGVVPHQLVDFWENSRDCVTVAHPQVIGLDAGCGCFIMLAYLANRNNWLGLIVH
jgi:hypothetical protein